MSIATTLNIGTDSGTYSWKKMRSSLAPSTRAASLRSFGIPSKKFLNRNKFIALGTAGSMTAIRLFFNCNRSIMPYSGRTITIDGIIIVKIANTIKIRDVFAETNLAIA